jgi:RimJ/RimL family protein N-acetyltransferase
VPAIRPPAELEDERISLRVLQSADIASYAAAFRADPELGRLLGYERDPTEGSLERRFERAQSLLDEGRVAELAVVDAATGSFLGSLTVHSIDWAHRRAEIGFFVVPAARRGGICTAAVRLALAWLFEELGFERIEMTTTPDNSAVPALAARLGFAREGVLRERNLERGQRVDVVMFGRLRDEWRTQRLHDREDAAVRSTLREKPLARPSGLLLRHLLLHFLRTPRAAALRAVPLARHRRARRGAGVGRAHADGAEVDGAAHDTAADVVRTPRVRQRDRPAQDSPALRPRQRERARDRAAVVAGPFASELHRPRRTAGDGGEEKCGHDRERDAR